MTEQWMCQSLSKSPRRFIRLLILMMMFNGASLATVATASGEPELLNHTFQSAYPRRSINLQEQYAGQVILVVNTASACGFTPQFEGLEALYQKYKQKGLVVLGFPSNDFYQERKQGKEIVDFCRLNYGVTFPIFKKSSVKGETANPFYQQLAAAMEGKSPRWNFFKYLVDRNQNVVELYPSQEQPLGGDMEKNIRRLLTEGSSARHD